MNKKLNKKIENEKIRKRIIKILKNSNPRIAKDIAEILDIKPHVATQHCLVLQKLGEINSFNTPATKISSYKPTPVWFIGEQLGIKDAKDAKDAKVHSSNIESKLDDEFNEWFAIIQSAIKNKDKTRELALKTGI